VVAELVVAALHEVAVTDAGLEVVAARAELLDVGRSPTSPRSTTRGGERLGVRCRRAAAGVDAQLEVVAALW
jgi:hypothetical protein